MIINNNDLYDSNAALVVLSSLMKSPLLLENNDFPITKLDFLQPLQQIIFSAIFNLEKQGFSTITATDIDVYLSQFSTQYAYYTKARGFEVLTHAVKIQEEFDIKRFEHNYVRLKKMSMLRDLNSLGFNIKDFYDTTTSTLERDKQDDKINALQLKEIPNRIREKLVTIENRHIGKDDGVGQVASKGLRELVEGLKENPEVGLPLDGEILNYATRGARLGKLYIYSAPSGTGKALPNSTQIPMFEGGFKPVGEVKIGDALIDRNGRRTLVEAVFPQGKKDVYQITFKDGRTAKCCNEHLWTYVEGDLRYNGEKTTTLQEIVEKVELKGYKDNYGGYLFKVPFNKAVEYQEKPLTLDPYVLGLLLGDGSFREQKDNRRLQFSSGTDELPKAIANIMGWSVQKSSDYNYTYTFKKEEKNIYVTEFLKEYGLYELYNIYSYEKYVPEQFFYGSIQQRQSLLQGLLDADGAICEKGRISFSSTSEKLINNVEQICHSLGYQVGLYKDKRRNKYTQNICYTLRIIAQPSEKLHMFRLARKKQRAFDFVNNGKRKIHYTYNPIIKIEKLNYQEEMTCFLVDNDEHLFLMNDYIVTHNTRHLVGNACGISLPYIDENKQIIIKEDLQKILFVATEMAVDEIQTLILAYVSGVNEKHILLGNYTYDEEMRIKMALDIIDRYATNFYIESMPDPSMAMIKARLTKYIIQEEVEFIFYDYIFSSPGLLGEFRDIEVREDVALMMLSNTLKEIAMTYNVFIQSATQLNDSWAKIEKGLRDQNCIRGSKAIVDKVDIGMIAVRIPDKEKECVAEMLKVLRETDPNNPQFFYDPNLVIDLYKNRRGELSFVKIFRRFDYSTCRSLDILITDTAYRAVEGVGQLKYESRPYDYLDLKTRGEL